MWEHAYVCMLMHVCTPESVCVYNSDVLKPAPPFSPQSNVCLFSQYQISVLIVAWNLGSLLSKNKGKLWGETRAFYMTEIGKDYKWEFIFLRQVAVKYLLASSPYHCHLYYCLYMYRHGGVCRCTCAHKHTCMGASARVHTHTQFIY